MASEAALARGALDVDVLVHALDVADCGVDAGGDGVDLHIDGVKASVQRGEALACAVLVVSGDLKESYFEASIDRVLMHQFVLVQLIWVLLCGQLFSCIAQWGWMQLWIHAWF